MADDPKKKPVEKGYLSQAWDAVSGMPGRVLESAQEKTAQVVSNISSMFNTVSDMAKPYLRQLWNNPTAMLPSFSFTGFADAFSSPYRAIYDGAPAQARLSRGGNSISRRMNEFQGWVHDHANLFDPTRLMTDEGAFSAVFGVKRFLEGGFSNQAWDPGGATAPGGVTRAGHPQAYRDIMALRAAGKFEQMETYLHDFYKRTYWDRLDDVLQLPDNFKFSSPGAKMFAFDIALNHGLRTARTIVQESGGDLSRMVEARFTHFAQQDNPGVVGQFNRVTIAGAIGEMTNAIIGGFDARIPDLPQAPANNWLSILR